MTFKHLCLLLLVVIACVAAQSEDELHIPVENDNQFPPDNIPETEEPVFEGSGVGAIEEPIDVGTTASSVPLEDVQVPIPENTETVNEEADDDTSCPKPCVCRIEGESNDFIVDCSGYGLTEFPSSINENTTSLFIQNNKLTEIPKEISQLKNLRELNAENNSIMDLASGSVSELAELKILKLGKNRLVEYPQDLKNGFGLTKLEELDLGGNDMRTILSSETFSSFKALQKLILPTTTNELIENLCNNLKESLDTICTESCTTQSYECPDAPEPVVEGDDLLSIFLPGTIALTSDFMTGNADTNTDNVETTPETQEKSVIDAAPTNEFSLRTAVNKDSQGDSPLNNIVQEPKDIDDEHQKVDVAVGATTTDSKTGGIDKSVIGMIIAGMVVVVAGITIKKNWSSIKKRFSSSPRPAERNAVNTNGTAPEEVPLQEKSPV